MLKETPSTSPTASVSAGRIVARLRATLQQAEQTRAELSTLEELLSSLSLAAADLIRTSTTSVDTEATEASLRGYNADERAADGHLSPLTTVEPSQCEWKLWRNWCSSPEAKNAFYGSGLSTSFSALERSVSDAVVLSASPKLQRSTEKVRLLCSTLEKRVQHARRKQSLPHARAQWGWEAVSALHQVAHASLEREDAEAKKMSFATPCVPHTSRQQTAHTTGKRDVFPAVSDAIWWEVYAGLRGVLHRTTPYTACTAMGKSEEVAEGRLELQRQRLLALLQEITICLVEDTSASG
ncbi:hypothetical protein GH5_00596 [Leishmania sp. Ghana 2012 LV757]|uniref:hypothetical protein n=1 Tax=Leishmania sp. Ghana 2012 LV757 TaxID=2803181 RepID=UPI001B6F6A04|nr:hypothetical protein GH5_00596 [Leishmania sp. Ghana 2012 LV757]